MIPSVAYTDPEVAWVGVTEDEAKAKGIKVKKGLFPWTASGRAIANGRDEGFTKLLFDEETHRIVGGGIVGTHAGDMIGEVALAIEMGADAVDIGKTIHPHPTLGESIGLAAEAYEGACTDLPPVSEALNAQRLPEPVPAGAGALRRHALRRGRRARRGRVGADLADHHRAARRRVVAGAPAGGLVGGSLSVRAMPSCVPQLVHRRVRARIGQRQVVLGVGVGAARGVDLVLGVQQVQQAALADVELLAVGVARLLDGQRVALEVDELLGRACACRCRRSRPPGACRGRRGRAGRRPGSSG